MWTRATTEESAQVQAKSEALSQEERLKEMEINTHPPVFRE